MMQSHSSIVNGAKVENGSSAALKEIPSASNMNSVSNGDSTDVEVLKLSSPVKNLTDSDKEVIRLVGQHLGMLGLKKTSETLMLESGCSLEHSSASKFRELIMQGHWSKVEATLNEMKSLLKYRRHMQKIRFLVMEQNFLELLEDGKVIEALSCLRNQITPINIYVKRIYQLSSFLMISNPQELQKAANWDGKGEKSRTKLLEKLQDYLPISVMMPPHRLKSLLEQAVLLQQSKCVYHNIPILADITSQSLLSDHACSSHNFPSTTQQILTEHTDEVLFCQFSHNGKMLATGSKDCSVLIWDVDPVTHTVTLSRSLVGHNYSIGYLSWSPDDTYLLACGTEDASELWLWNVEEETVHSKLVNSSDDSLSCCCWMADGKKYIAGGSKGQFYLCDLGGVVIDSWEGVRLQCVGSLPDNRTVLAADTQLRVRAYNFDDMTNYDLIKEDHPIISFSLSEDCKLMLVHVATQGVHLWDVESQILIRKYHGVEHGTFVIFSCFGGSSNQFIASGSEDNHVYIWHQSREKAIEKLAGHTKSVNCVSWNKTISSMLASASDDGTVRIWGPKETPTPDFDKETYGFDN